MINIQVKSIYYVIVNRSMWLALNQFAGFRIVELCQDMDGTLTVPVINFSEMRRRVGIKQGDILEVIKSWPVNEQRRAYSVIAEIEQEALKDMKVMPGAVELCRFLDDNLVPRGLITRNVAHSVDYFHQHHFPLRPFDPALSREFTPYKPAPQSLQHICRFWSIPAEQCVIIGDSAKDDIVCGNRAGAITILFDSYKRHVNSNSNELFGEQEPMFKVESLEEVQQILQSRLVLKGQ
eukprot:TRINITY_DN8640_c0_g1_i1.p1 TRINITY_DN8640_c0_g1~~TRINITY_DN8640_c0_g1_i1.p1  ORF type:complete len:236 (-),score=10.99 TRINITY_DN8640_c0_g1_i1:297-1004(-)